MTMVRLEPTLELHKLFGEKPAEPGHLYTSNFIGPGQLGEKPCSDNKWLCTTSMVFPKSIRDLGSEIFRNIYPQLHLRDPEIKGDHLLGPLLKMGSQTWEAKRSFQVDSLWASEHL